MITLTGKFLRNIVEMSGKDIINDQILLKTEVINEDVSIKKHPFKKLIFAFKSVCNSRYYY